MSIKNTYLAVCQKIGACLHAPTRTHGQISLFLLGIALLAVGLHSGAIAQDIPDASEIAYNDERIGNAVQTIFGYIEGTFGALIMVVSGLAAILSSAFGQYRAALGCLVVAVGAFILRSVVATFFNIENIDGF